MKGLKLIQHHPIPVLESITGLEYSPFQRDVILSDHPRCCVMSPRQSGKSEALVGVALRTILSGNDKKVVIFNPSVRQSNALLDRVRSYLFRWGIVPTLNSRGEIILENESGVVSRPIKSSARGENCDALLIDELAWLEEQQDDDIFAVALPYLSKPGSRLVISSTPRGRRGLFHKIWTDDNDFQKIQGTISEVKHYAEGFLDSQRAMLGDILYRREYLTRFDELDESSLFSELDIQKLLGGTCSQTITDQKNGSDAGGLGSIPPPARVKTILQFA